MRPHQPMVLADPAAAAAVPKKKKKSMVHRDNESCCSCLDSLLAVRLPCAHPCRFIIALILVTLSISMFAMTASGVAIVPLVIERTKFIHSGYLSLPCYLTDTQLTKMEFMIQEFVTVAAEVNLTYFIQSGTLLGAMRTGKLIKYDKDVDIGFLATEYGRFLRMCDIFQRRLKDKDGQPSGPKNDGKLCDGMQVYGNWIKKVYCTKEDYAKSVTLKNDKKNTDDTTADAVYIDFMPQSIIEQEVEVASLNDMLRNDKIITVQTKEEATQKQENTTYAGDHNQSDKRHQQQPNQNHHQPETTIINNNNLNRPIKVKRKMIVPADYNKPSKQRHQRIQRFLSRTFSPSTAPSESPFPYDDIFPVGSVDLYLHDSDSSDDENDDHDDQNASNDSRDSDNDTDRPNGQGWGRVDVEGAQEEGGENRTKSKGGPPRGPGLTKPKLPLLTLSTPRNSVKWLEAEYGKTWTVERPYKALCYFNTQASTADKK